MSEFVASNGIIVVEEPDGEVYIRDDRDRSGADHAQALREFFQAEGDERLGRWRWPENPDYVVYALEKIGMEGVKVIHETDGYQQSFETRSQATKRPGLIPAQAAVAYFDAHPEPEWHNAKEGEVWIITYNGNSYPAIFQAERFRDHAGSWRAADVTAAHRIWPQEAAS